MGTTAKLAAPPDWLTKPERVSLMTEHLQLPGILRVNPKVSQLFEAISDSVLRRSNVKLDLKLKQ